MRFQTKLTALGAALAIFALPALAGAAVPENQGTAHKPETHGPAVTPGPSASLPAKAKAYGVYCRGESKEHVKGEKGTAFSRCVTAMAKLAKGTADTPREACSGESRKHVKGEKGTPFSRCVSAAAKLQHDLDDEDGGGGE